jgi:hypothetical protein
VLARILADAIVVAHLAFIAFVLVGGAWVLLRPRVAWVHLPAVAWVAYAELSATICPLTPLENVLRRRAGDAGYDGGFVEHYVIPVIYPAGLTPEIQSTLGAVVIAVNFAVYAIAWRRRSEKGASGRHQLAMRLHAHQNAQADEKRHHGGAAVGDERQRNAHDG